MAKRQRNTKKENKVDYGLTCVGNIRVFSKERQVKNFNITDYWCNVSKKLENGDYENKSLKLIFGRDSDTPESNTVITIKDSCFLLNGEGKYTRIALFVRDWDYVEEDF